MNKCTCNIMQSSMTCCATELWDLRRDKVNRTAVTFSNLTICIVKSAIQIIVTRLDLCIVEYNHLAYRAGITCYICTALC